MQLPKLSHRHITTLYLHATTTCTHQQRGRPSRRQKLFGISTQRGEGTHFPALEHAELPARYQETLHAILAKVMSPVFGIADGQHQCRPRLRRSSYASRTKRSAFTYSAKSLESWPANPERPVAEVAGWRLFPVMLLQGDPPMMRWHPCSATNLSQSECGQTG